MMGVKKYRSISHKKRLKELNDRRIVAYPKQSHFDLILGYCESNEIKRTKLFESLISAFIKSLSPYERKKYRKIFNGPPKIEIKRRKK